MTGTTTGQTSLPTCTDSDDTENYLTVSLVSALQALANLFESASGHDHSGSGKGKPVGTAGIASGITLTSPHMTTPVVDSGGLTITAGGLTVTAGNVGIGAAPSANAHLLTGGTINASGAVAYGGNISSSLVAAANNDTLNGLLLAAGYNANAKTGVAAVGLNIPAFGMTSTGGSNYGALVGAVTGGGTNNYGVYINAPSGASGNNIGLYNLGATKLTPAAFVASDKYLVVDASGNVHVSALGPAS